MDINMHIIMDELQQYNPKGVIKDSIELNIKQPRLVKQESTVFSKDYLYVTDSEIFVKRFDEFKDYNVVCVGSYNLEMTGKKMNCICISSSFKLIDIYDSLLDIFEKYTSWNLKLLNSIVKNNPLQDVLNIGATVLENPIAMFDASFVFIMMAGDLPKNYEGTIWEDVMSTGHAPFYKHPIEEQRKAHNFLISNKTPFFYKHNVTDKHNQIMASIFVNEKRFGLVGLIDINKPFTLGQLSLVHHIVKKLQDALEKSREFIDSTEDSIYWIDRLIKGFSIEEKIVHYHLTKKKWSASDNYYIVYFSGTNSLVDEDLLNVYMHKINKIINYSITLLYENSIVSIIRELDHSPKDLLFMNSLEELVDKFGLKFGISMMFSNIMDLKYYYIQSKVALSEGIQKNKQCYKCQPKIPQKCAFKIPQFFWYCTSTYP